MGWIFLNRIRKNSFSTSLDLYSTILSHKMHLYVYFIVFRLFKNFYYNELDMLDEYKKKRNFKAFPEPNGNNSLNKENFAAPGDASISTDDHNQSKSRPRFVIQKH